MTWEVPGGEGGGGVRKLMATSCMLALVTAGCGGGDQAVTVTTAPPAETTTAPPPATTTVPPTTIPASDLDAVIGHLDVVLPTKAEAAAALGEPVEERFDYLHLPGVVEVPGWRTLPAAATAYYLDFVTTAGDAFVQLALYEDETRAVAALEATLARDDFADPLEEFPVAAGDDAYGFRLDRFYPDLLEPDLDLWLILGRFDRMLIAAGIFQPSSTDAGGSVAALARVVVDRLSRLDEVIAAGSVDGSVPVQPPWFTMTAQPSWQELGVTHLESGPWKVELGTGPNWLEVRRNGVYVGGIELIAYPLISLPDLVRRLRAGTDAGAVRALVDEHYDSSGGDAEGRGAEGYRFEGNPPVEIDMGGRRAIRFLWVEYEDDQPAGGQLGCFVLSGLNLLLFSAAPEFDAWADAALLVEFAPIFDRLLAEVRLPAGAS